MNLSIHGKKKKIQYQIGITGDHTARIWAIRQVRELATLAQEQSTRRRWHGERAIWDDDLNMITQKPDLFRADKTRARQILTRLHNFTEVFLFYFNFTAHSNITFIFQLRWLLSDVLLPVSVSGLPQLCDAWLHGGQPHPGAVHHALQQRLPVDPAHGAQQAHRPAESCRRLPFHQGGAGLFGGPEGRGGGMSAIENWPQRCGDRLVANTTDITGWTYVWKKCTSFEKDLGVLAW